MHDGSSRQDAHIHPAIRHRILEVSTDSRLKSIVLAGVSAAKLAQTIECLDSLTSPKFLCLGAEHYRMVRAMAELLRIISGYLWDWEKGEVPTPAEASALVDGLAHCKHFLPKWMSLLEGH